MTGERVTLAVEDEERLRLFLFDLAGDDRLDDEARREGDTSPTSSGSPSHEMSTGLSGTPGEVATNDESPPSRRWGGGLSDGPIGAVWGVHGGGA